MKKEDYFVWVQCCFLGSKTSNKKAIKVLKKNHFDFDWSGKNLICSTLNFNYQKKIDDVEKELKEKDIKFRCEFIKITDKQFSNRSFIHA